MKHIFSKSIGIIIPVLLLISFSTSAQRKAPGYMGKRFVLMYSQGISWSFGKSIRAAPNLFYTLQGDFAISKKYSVGAEYSFRSRYYGSEFNRYSLGSNFQLERQFAHKIGIYTKMFSQRNGHIAPAGPYFIVGGHVHILHSNFRVRPNDYAPIYSIRDKGYTFDIAPFIGGGKQYIVGNRFVLDVSMRISLPLISIFRNARFNDVGLFVSGGVAEEVEYRRGKALRAAQPNFEANILELRIGFGGVM